MHRIENDIYYYTKVFAKPQHNKALLYPTATANYNGQGFSLDKILTGTFFGPARISDIIYWEFIQIFSNYLLSGASYFFDNA